MEFNSKLRGGAKCWRLRSLLSILSKNMGGWCHRNKIGNLFRLKSKTQHPLPCDFQLNFRIIWLHVKNSSQNLHQWSLLIKIDGCSFTLSATARWSQNKFVFELFLSFKLYEYTSQIETVFFCKSSFIFKFS